MKRFLFIAMASLLISCTGPAVISYSTWGFCDKEDPLNDLPWLANIIEKPLMHPYNVCVIKEVKVEFEEEQFYAFYVMYDTDPVSPDAQIGYLYDCDGNVIADYTGLTGGWFKGVKLIEENLIYQRRP